MPLTPDHIAALAPDSSSAAAGRKLASTTHWPMTGKTDAALWGECQGSKLYQCKADLAQFAYGCNCPSRKLPCKHILGLMFLAAENRVDDAAPPDWVSDWLEKREKRAEKKAGERPWAENGVAPAEILGFQPARPREEAILLEAALVDVIAAAGFLPPVTAERPPRCEAEALPGCSEPVVAIVRELLAEKKIEFLRLVLRRIKAAGRLVQPVLLPALFDHPDAEVRRAARSAAGRRGDWLTAILPAGRRKADLVEEGPPPSDEDELSRRWQEGAPAERLAALAQIRRQSGEKGRQWIEAVWKQEKADLRQEILGILETTLDPADEPLLEKALADRSQLVRQRAAHLLMKIPHSGLFGRMTRRAEDCLAFTPPGEAKGFLRRLFSSAAGKTATGSLAVTLPAVGGDQKELERDGINTQAPAGVGPGAWLFRQMVGVVPPGHWTGTFQATPGALVEALRGNEWAALLAQSWAEAAIMHEDREWVAVLWAWFDNPEHIQGGAEALQAAQCRQRLFPHLPPGERETLVIRKLVAAEEEPPIPWGYFLAGFSTPWGPGLATAYLARLQAEIRAAAGRNRSAQHYQLLLTAAVAALKLPDEFCRELALAPELAQPGALPPSSINTVAEFNRVMAQRQTINKELPL